ncbi:cation diffusion facilitator family transporter [Aspergillus clavatus NRRL 1]|uniref:Cation diffusion facilitator 1 n=1 Tax=Aspergillus clavatus (strain ATCC 1007 / CBS 513.65 / DSM 816 / NCTC 3887 / NRRL 1 / QM 1276 / 107) TaxID=344612 RepID=A1CP19_ASPCL|nr:cation diffusion facilitator 1 [Aspergillus clavatus NRRL 1]EAW07390.1 cation diffusion facilitator 1 [Aspergillus clavatus NRRL 1]
MEDSHFRHSISNYPSPLNPHTHTHVSRDRSTSGLSYNEATSTALDPLDQQPSHTSQHRGHTSSDEEDQPPPRYTQENDPFQLASKLKTAEEIRQIQPQANTSRKRNITSTTTPAANASDNGRRSTRNPISRTLASRQLQRFYRTQNENIERMLKPVEEHVRDARELNANNQLRYRIAVYGSFAANIMLSVLQLYGAISSGSLSLFTTMADSIFDPCSNLTLLLCNKAVNRVDPRRFPAGKARIETAGNICFCFLMTAVSFILIAFSIRDLAAGSDQATGSFHLPSVIAVVVAFCTKLALFLYCFALRNQVSQIRILWEDHRNDLLINGFGILTSVGGSKLRWWIDPMGAVILSVLISGLWLHTAYHEFLLLIGVTADTKMQQLITYISMTHSPLITAIDTVRAYTSGPRLLVEVDIVMDPEDSLRATHDVAEELQMKLESLPDVERAYVHVDYETTHKPEHSLKKEL